METWESFSRLISILKLSVTPEITNTFPDSRGDGVNAEGGVSHQLFFLFLQCGSVSSDLPLRSSQLLILLLNDICNTRTENGSESACTMLLRYSHT